MRLLLDTHIWIDCAAAPASLGRRLKREVASPRAELWISPISVWEFLKLSERKRLSTRNDPLQSIERMLQALPIREAPITLEVAREMSVFSLPHRDPADAWLVATARVNGLVLATRDAKIIASGVVETLADT